LKKASKQSNSPILFKLALLVLIILLGIWFLYPGNPSMNSGKKDNQNVAQLSPSASGSGMGTATYEKSDYVLNVSGVLSKPSKGKDYYVWLKDDSSTTLLGKMEAAGDVYSLTYQGDKSMSSKDVVISLQTDSEAKSGKIVGEVLSGGFEK
jgi:hypothetical protein